jgi:hypothetical protein
VGLAPKADFPTLLLQSSHESGDDVASCIPEYRPVPRVFEPRACDGGAQSPQLRATMHVAVGQCCGGQTSLKRERDVSHHATGQAV